MKIFLSWSGKGSKSHQVAQALQQWLPPFCPHASVWFSASSIEPGHRWRDELYKGLKDTQFGVLCLSKEAMGSEWVLFEAGALSQSISDARVVPFLLDVPADELPDPLKQFQSVQSDRDGTFQLCRSITRALPASAERPVESERILSTLFDKFWPDLEVKLRTILPSAPSAVIVKHPAAPFLAAPKTSGEGEAIISWAELAPERQESIDRRMTDFVQDASYIVSRPDLFGRWELIVTGEADSEQLALRSALVVSNEGQEQPLRLEIFPLGRYPMNGPSVAIVKEDRPRSPTKLTDALKTVCSDPLWNERYRRMPQKMRLIHIVDNIMALRSPIGLFRLHALEVTRSLRGWRLTAEGHLQGALSGKPNGKSRTITISPTAKYPLETPTIRCSPVPKTSQWLANGEPNWKLLFPESTSPWLTAMKTDNPLEDLAGRLK